MKRTIDLVLAAAVLVLTAPVQAVVAALVRREDGPPVLFRQERAGKDGKPFVALKFRSMRVHDLAPSAVGQVGVDHPLVTRTGRVIRRLKLDELPQLINVLRGELSLVGPRPALLADVAAYDPFARRRLSVRPGLTGWAQVNGNVSLSWDDRILLDVWYVDHRSAWLDLRILFRTLAVVVAGERVDVAALEEARRHAHGAGRCR